MELVVLDITVRDWGDEICSTATDEEDEDIDEDEDDDESWRIKKSTSKIFSVWTVATEETASPVKFEEEEEEEEAINKLLFEEEGEESVGGEEK